MSKNPLHERYHLAKQYARAAGELTLKYFRADVEIQRKADDSPVTIADQEAEQLLRDAICADFPDDAIVGEEYGTTPGTSGFEWVLDPIDGTKSFIHGVPLYGTMVGILHAGQPVAGVIEIPGLNERIAGGPGLGAWYQRGDEEWESARVSPKTRMNEGLFVTSEVAGFFDRGAGNAFERLDRAARLTRTWGDCYGYLLVITGRAEVMIDPELNVWDAAAVFPILEAAGGRFTDWSGKATIHSREGIGSNGLIHDEVLSLLA